MATPYSLIPSSSKTPYLSVHSGVEVYFPRSLGSSKVKPLSFETNFWGLSST